MKNFLFFLLISGCLLGARAQPTASPETIAGQTAPEQRRAELRSSLKAPSGREAQEKDQTPENVALGWHLSAQERANLRQQLRQLRNDDKPDGR